jgi:hypothetical protein
LGSIDMENFWTIWGTISFSSSMEWVSESVSQSASSLTPAPHYWIMTPFNKLFYFLLMFLHTVCQMVVYKGFNQPPLVYTLHTSKFIPAV